MAKHNENVFQNEIIEDLVKLGWKTAVPNGYIRHMALYAPDVIAYIRDTQPQEWNKVKRLYKTDDAVENEILKTIAKEVDIVAKKKTGKERHGVLSILRKGFKCYGATFKMMQPKPNSENHATHMERYNKTICRVIPELLYSDRNMNRIDLVLFVNGLPTATVELKTDFTQSVQDAIHQYKVDRLPQNERLLTFKTGAPVHFALSGDECYMTTKLDGKDTFFLPFNRGNDGGAGNAPNPNGYPASYVWQAVWKPENWLDILKNYIHMNIDNDNKEKLIFPRFHQWDAVEKITTDVEVQGAGTRYLVQHSAGSGKTNSIAWLAHKLSNQYEGANHRFSSVIVITDRTILDEQLQASISQLDPTVGIVVKSVTRTADSSKSKKLAEFLDAGSRIIVTTLQTFPFAIQHMADSKSLKGKNFAIIADEAHSSQSGGTIRGIYKNLKSQPENLPNENDVVTGEDFIMDTLEYGGASSNLSLFAFTATPKDKTIQIFGTRPNPDIPPADDNVPQAFHHYTMKQAIEEGFILNVLENHMHYETAFHLSTEDWADERILKERKGEIAIKDWVKSHPTSIGEKVGVIVNHFITNVAHLLNGQAKAMVVTSSRLNVVRYKKAFDQYLKTHKITNVQALVAFSGSIDDEGQEYTENSMNSNLGGMGIADAFDTGQYNILLVANKFQTGFDQPKLVAMYVDKKISNIECVQTLSRLNRCYPNKDKTFIIDFENKTDDVISDFEKYYKHTKLANVSDPNHIYTIMDMLLDEGIFDNNDVNSFFDLYIKKQYTQAMLYAIMQKPADIFKDRYHTALLELQNGEKIEDVNAIEQATKALNGLNEFKKRLATFVNYYEFIGQVIDLQDTDLEKQRLFCKHFGKFIATSTKKEDVDITGVRLDFYEIKARQAQNTDLSNEDGVLTATNAVGTKEVHTEEEKRLADIVEKINDIFGTTGDGWKESASYMDKIAEHIYNDDIAIDQIINSGGDARRVLGGRRVKDIISDAVIADMDRADKVLDKEDDFNELMINYVYHKKMGK